MMKLWQWIVSQGVSDDMDFDLRKKVRIINQFSILAIIITSVFVIINFVKGKYLLSFIEVVIVLTEFLNIYLNNTKRYKVGRVLFFIIMLSFFSLLTFWLAKGRDLEYFFIICVILPLILFDKPRWVYSLSLLSFLIFLTSSLHNYEQRDVVYHLNHLALFSLVFYLMSYFKKEYDANRELIAQQVKSLEKLDEEKNQLISIASHDLRSPINSVKGLLTIIQLSEDKNSKESEELLEMSQKILMQQSEMITSVLTDFVINEKAGANKKLEDIDIVTSLKRIVDGFKIEAEKKTIVLKLETPEVLQIKTDKNFFSHIFDNLISNAIKFSFPESVIEVNAFETANGVFISVKDQGQGLSDEDKRKLFQKFQKLSAQPTFGEISTGLGLSIVKKYTDALGGKIYVESEKGKGAKFIVELPKS